MPTKKKQRAPSANPRGADIKSTTKKGFIIEVKSKVIVARSPKTGAFTVNGVAGKKFINQHPSVKVQSAPGKPKHLTGDQIRNMVRSMKVA